MATLIGSGKQDATDLAIEYSQSHKFNYHLIYFLSAIASGGSIPPSSIHIVVGSALEFRSTATSIELNVEADYADVLRAEQYDARIVVTEVEIFLGKDKEKSKSFTFASALGNAKSVFLGSRLSSAYISLPCGLSLSAPQELELTAPVEIVADTISLQAPALVLRHLSPHSQDDIVFFDANWIDSAVTNIITNGVDLVFSTSRREDLSYPAAKFFYERVRLPEDPLLKEKFLRLKRILMSFRSHSRGTLARYRHMIENTMIAGNETGQLVLSRLLADGIVSLRGNFYFLEPANVDKHLGISWADLRKGHVTEKLFGYLRNIN